MLGLVLMAFAVPDVVSRRSSGWFEASLGSLLATAGWGLLHHKELARRCMVAIAWLVSLYTATALILILGIDLMGDRFVLRLAPDWEPSRQLWIGMVLSVLLLGLALVASLGTWWILSRADVRKLTAGAPRSRSAGRGR